VSEVHLIGTLPQDPDGASRLCHVLEQIRPDAIAVEDHARVLAPDSQAHLAATETLVAIEQRLVDSSLSLIQFWEQRLAPEQVHFQAFTCAAYASQCGVALHFLGDDGAEPDSVGDATGLAQLDADTLRSMAAFDWQQAYAADYARARNELEAKGCIEFLVLLDQHRAFYERDRSLSSQLMRILQSKPGVQRLAFVCSVPHLYFSDDGLTIYMQLERAHTTVRRYLADDAGEVRDLATAHPN
jgi:hypothetical protein